MAEDEHIRHTHTHEGGAAHVPRNSNTLSDSNVDPSSNKRKHLISSIPVKKRQDFQNISLELCFSFSKSQQRTT